MPFASPDRVTLDELHAEFAGMHADALRSRWVSMVLDALADDANPGKTRGRLGDLARALVVVRERLCEAEPGEGAPLLPPPRIRSGRPGRDLVSVCVEHLERIDDAEPGAWIKLAAALGCSNRARVVAKALREGDAWEVAKRTGVRGRALFVRRVRRAAGGDA